MKERRAIDPRIEEIHDAVKQNSSGIADLNARFEPVEEVWNDVAAVGRFGKFIKAVVVWCTVVGGGIAAIYHSIVDTPSQWFK